ncbi:MAG: hypothetical protein ACRDD8_06160 [Bacteroidales bacterium]
MIKYNTTAYQRYEYSIAIDESIWDEKALQDFSKVFYPIDDTYDLANAVCANVIHFGVNKYHEGFGYYKTIDTDGKQVPIKKCVDGHLIDPDEDEFCPGVLVSIIESCDRIDDITISIEELD